MESQEPHLNQLVQTVAAVDEEDFWLVFRSVWQKHTVLHPFQSDIRQLLTVERLKLPERIASMAADEQDWFVNRIRQRKPVKIYRGCSPKTAAGFSWTTDASIAKNYAKLCGDPVLVSGYIDLGSVVLRNHRGGDKEIICFPEHVRKLDFNRLS